MDPKYKDRNALYCRTYYQRLRGNPLKWQALMEQKRKYRRLRKRSFKPS